MRNRKSPYKSTGKRSTRHGVTTERIANQWDEREEQVWGGKQMPKFAWHELNSTGSSSPGSKSNIT